MWKVLLSHLQASLELFTQEWLKKVTLPQASPGQHGTSGSLVLVTLHSPRALGSLLGPEVMVGGERTNSFERTASSSTETTDPSSEGD